MKKMLALAIVALMAGSASAQLGMGLFFSNTDFTPENTNFDPTPGVPFDAFIVVMGLGEANTPEGVGAYEVGITISDATVFVLGATGPNGWTNFGLHQPHRRLRDARHRGRQRRGDRRAAAAALQRR